LSQLLLPEKQPTVIMSSSVSLYRPAGRALVRAGFYTTTSGSASQAPTEEKEPIANENEDRTEVHFSLI
jgi:hypothetical protein